MGPKGIYVKEYQRQFVKRIKISTVEEEKRGGFNGSETGQLIGVGVGETEEQDE